MNYSVLRNVYDTACSFIGSESSKKRLLRNSLLFLTRISYCVLIGRYRKVRADTSISLVYDRDVKYFRTPPQERTTNSLVLFHSTGLFVYMRRD